MSRFFVTTAIAYPNGRPHIGHAYEAIATDMIARWHRLAGDDVFFLTGTDEHGLKIAQAARGAGVEPRAYVDTMVAHYREMDARLNISFDRFIRTTDEDHRTAVQTLWQRMADAGDLYLDRYEGWYSVRDEAFYAESELIDGPNGKLSPQGTPVEWNAEESWFFRLSRYAEPLLALYAARPDFVAPPGRMNEMRSFVAGGLQDLSVSRTSFDWGVAVPDAPGHVMYVWVDALTNYLSATGYPEPGWEMRWPADLHVIGKDVVRFHAVYWPAFLMSAGLPLPRQVFGHGFVLMNGEKMSKSLGNVIEPVALATAFGVDALRYFLLRNISFGQDGEWSHDAIVERTNADLANGLGNLAQRTLTLIQRNHGGVVADPGPDTDADRAFADALSGMRAEVTAAMARLALNEALAAIWARVAAANQYITEQQPWALAKTDPARAGGVLTRLADAVRRIAILASPAMPDSCAELLRQLGQTASPSLATFDQALMPGQALPQPAGVFPRWTEPK